MLITIADEKTKEREGKIKNIHAEIHNIELDKSEKGESIHAVKSDESRFDVILVIVVLQKLP